MSVWTIRDEKELVAIAREVISVLSKKDGSHTLTLQGDLGAGKTAFVKALARELGIKEHITSPTFVIMKSYQILSHPLLTTLTHIDAYRIEDESEMSVLGFEEILTQSGNLVCIEWPERIRNLIPKDAYKISLRIETDGSRTLTYGE